MRIAIQLERLIELGLTKPEYLVEQLKQLEEQYNDSEKIWHIFCTEFAKTYSISIQQYIFQCLFPNAFDIANTAPACLANPNAIQQSNLSQSIKDLNFTDYQSFHTWSVDHYQLFWKYTINKLGIIFKKSFSEIVDLTNGLSAPKWLPSAEFNIVDSCFNAPPSAVAIIYEDEKDKLQRLTYQELESHINQIANSLKQLNFHQGDVIAICMPMNIYCVAIYLAIIKLGATVTSIADSFSPQEIALRLSITKAKAIFTQDYFLWDEKEIHLYKKIKESLTYWNQEDFKVIVVPCKEQSPLPLAPADILWKSFLGANNQFTSVACTASTPETILFSSGTTGTPKAIIWDHSTPIKAASDAFFHHNIKANDVICWPTNLGWMMGPWLIYAALINQACIAISKSSPKNTNFGLFVQNAKVTMLGVVPSLVAQWKASACMENCDWSAIKNFSSTGECSNPKDMFYLMALAGYKPVIEYCGGTEIGGAYVTSTVIQNNYPSMFTTPALGLDFILFNEERQIANKGEVAIVAPSIGLSNQLLNSNNEEVYYHNMPKFKKDKILRRHGDQLMQLSNGLYTMLGRVDDTMNLGGIKISATEIERVISGTIGIKEAAAIAINKESGPSLLVIYAVTNSHLDKEQTKVAMQKSINTLLNPLFKIYDLIFCKELPKTASNKIMRRMLRKKYETLSS